MMRSTWALAMLAGAATSLSGCSSPTKTAAQAAPATPIYQPAQVPVQQQPVPPQVAAAPGYQLPPPANYGGPVFPPGYIPPAGYPGAPEQVPTPPAYQGPPVVPGQVYYPPVAAAPQAAPAVEASKNPIDRFFKWFKGRQDDFDYEPIRQKRSEMREELPYTD